ncbi:hypothetical protein DCC81_10100 [Chitinophaga parva]|uniref:Uncharacterized protein n=1 Tax=Chitinophaga parva TaxID=2169414 RepID=A0A2T7BQ14_9BACT|nr:hypothetical protein DCC81_10100 [Chitinophaga parva]
MDPEGNQTIGVNLILYSGNEAVTRERDQLVQERTIVKNQLHAELSEAEPNRSSINSITWLQS